MQPFNPTSMFTTEQIKAAHSKVKSGADFPAYILDIKALGVTGYEAYVSDGHIDYHGTGDYTAKVPAKYHPLIISETTDQERFKEGLKAHQQGRTDFPTFVKMCAETGIEKWQVSMKEMICTYFDIAGNVVLVERIPTSPLFPQYTTS